MPASLTENCTSEAQLEKIIKGQERKFRWRDDWPALEKALMETGTASILKHNRSKKIDGIFLE
ncbi:hypothetical protein [Hymenobacter sp.]|jgi:hypothetical protein|uniref:hypothetical protein n=1 Tax=Hymenobacter sp. TaxID=1898978 RepID=UPI002ED8A9CA